MKGGAYTQSAALTEGGAGEWVLGPGVFTHCLGCSFNRGPNFIDLANLGTFPYAFPRERGAETATDVSNGRTRLTGEILTNNKQKIRAGTKVKEGRLR